MMGAVFSILIVLVVLIVVIVAYGIGCYNRFVEARNAFKNAFSQIEVQLVRRYDLIPNLLESVKAYLKHENETLTQVTEARNIAAQGLKKAAASPGDPARMSQLMQANGALNSALSRLMLVVEAYPELKANETIAQFSKELANTENLIAAERKIYNDSAMHYNTITQVFPANIVAGLFHFGQAAFLEAPAEKKEAPKVSFN
jgi:Uncharacterized conserved protein